MTITEIEETQVDDVADNEEIDDKDVIYEIYTSGADFDIDGLIKRFDRNDIFRPSFQRQYVWSQPQASKFIESILLGLPIPSIFLYKEEVTNKLLIVDGLQRLTTMHAFVKGIFPTNEKLFKLQKLKSKFDGITYDTLSDEDRRRFDDTIIHAFVIQQTTPKGNKSAVFHIFDRLNSNGTPLQPQEMRSAIYHGKFLELIEELNNYKPWRNIFGKVHKRSKDAELILRFFALYYKSDKYKSPVNTFLNDFLEKNRNLQLYSNEELTQLFYNTMSRVNNALGDLPFRPTRAMNVANFDSFCVGVARNPDADNTKILSAYTALHENDDYKTSINDSTSAPSSVSNRIRLATEFLQ